MSLREKHKAQTRLTDMSDEAFEKESGVVDEMKNMSSLEDVIERMKFERKREDLKAKKMRDMSDKGIDYVDDDEISVSEDDFDEEDQLDYKKFFAERRKK
jgi:hypothetical protein